MKIILGYLKLRGIFMILLKTSQLPDVDINLYLPQVSDAGASWVLWKSCINPKNISFYLFLSAIWGMTLVVHVLYFHVVSSVVKTYYGSFSHVCIMACSFRTIRVTCGFGFSKVLCSIKDFYGLGVYFLDHVWTYLCSHIFHFAKL